MNIIFSSSGSGGDVLPFLRLGKRLKARGHDVTLISHCCYQKMAGRSGMAFSALDSAEEYAAFSRDGPLLNTPRGTLESIRRYSLPRLLREVERVQERYRKDETVLVTRDLFDLGCRMASEKFEIPAVWVFMAPVQIAAGRLRLQMFRDILASEINRLRAKIALPPVSDWNSWLGYPERSIALWPDWFAAPQDDWPAKVISVGFLMDDELFAADLPADTEEILNGQPSPVLITSGTGMYLGSDFYAAAAAACRLLDLPAILVAPHKRMLPARLPENVRWFRQLPFSRVMTRVGAVVHHGGIGTIASALAAGTPQLALAYGADRPDNAARLKRLGVADYLLPTAWRPSTVAEKLRELTNSEAVAERCREFSARMSLTNPLASACEIIEAAIGNPSSSPHI